MKKLTSILALLLLILTVSPPASAAASPTQPSTQEHFYQKVADLLSEQDNSSYFGEMELKIGSNILTIDGEERILSAAPEIMGERTMLPIRAVAEAAGAKVDWVQSTSTVLIESAWGDEISCTIGSRTITVNDESSSMDVTPYVKQGKTYLPVRAVSEALDLEVSWENSTQTVRLTAPYQTARLLVWSDYLNTRELGAEKVITDGAGLWVLQFCTPSQAKEAAAALSAKGIVAEPDTYIPPIENVTIPADTSQMGEHLSWGAADCGFDTFINAYSDRFSGHSGVVAVVDTGVDSGHPFLYGRVLSGYDFIDGDSTPQDGNSHGTHVAGTVIDCIGAAPVNILPVRVLNNKGEGTSLSVATGIRYAADHGADVINLSLGGACGKVGDYAVSYAIEKGCVVVAAAGNENDNTANSCPAHITTGGTIVVSAGDSFHRRADFSNYGSSVDMMAPGVGIKAAIPGGSYGLKNGTSMATPHVSAAAVLLDLAWGKTLTPAQLEAELRTATTYGRWVNEDVGCGWLDLSRASAPPEVVTPGITLNNNSFSIKIGETRTVTASVTPNGTTVNWSSSNVGVATVSDGKITAVKQGSAVITAKIVYEGKTYQASCIVTVSAELGEWSTTPLTEKPGYRIETKQQYRSRTMETTNSTQSSLPGWTLHHTSTTDTWGPWSEWKDGGIFNVPDTMQVETRQVEGNRTRYYNLYYYKYWNSSAGAYYYTYSSSMGGTKYTATVKASDCTPSKSYDGYQAYTYDGWNIWWIESFSDVGTSGQQYRTRSLTQTTTYYFYRWTDWSNWGDTSMVPSDGLEVESRTLYRYIPA